MRDRGLFERAIAQPRHTYFYTNGDLFDIAAAYAYHIAQAQACFDGNKRTGVAAAFLFLELNAVSTDFDSMPLYEAMIAIASEVETEPQTVLKAPHMTRTTKVDEVTAARKPIIRWRPA